MMEEIFSFQTKEKDNNIIKAVSLDDIDLFTLCVYPTEKKLNAIYSYGFVLIKIIQTENYTKYIFSKRLNDNYILTEEQLLNLIEDSIVLRCLDTDGVDNWSWYMESKNSTIADTLDIPIQEVIENDLTFRDAAKKEINRYKKLEN